jgi:hypothetical protein
MAESNEMFRLIAGEKRRVRKDRPTPGRLVITGMTKTQSISEQAGAGSHVLSDSFSGVLGLWPYLFILVSIVGLTCELVSALR